VSNVVAAENSSGPSVTSRSFAQRLEQSDVVVLTVVAFHLLTVVATLVRYDGFQIAKSYLADDTFYYLHIANNIADGLGSTFDGVSRTNGYHPLWMVFCCAIALVVPHDFQIEVLYGAQGLLAASTAWLLYRGLSRIDRWAAAAATTLFLTSGAVRFILLNGMESALGMTLLSAVAFVLLRQERPGVSFRTPAERWTLFLLLAGLSLSRLEMALVAAACLGTGFFLWSDSANRRGALVVAFGLALVGGAYLALNLAIADWPVPISGSVKWGQAEAPEIYLKTLHFHLTSFMRPLLAPERLHRAVIEVPLALTLLGALGVLAKREQRVRAVALALVVPCIVFAVLAAHRSGGFSWYGWPALFAGTVSSFAFFAVAFQLVTERFASFGRRVPYVVGGLLVAYALTLSAGRVIKPRPTQLFDWSKPEPLFDATVAFIRGLPPEDRLSGSSVGLLAFITERGIVQTEGLVNDREYLEALRAGTAREVLERRKVDWFIGVVDTREQKFPELFHDEDIESQAFITSHASLPPLGTPNDVLLVRFHEQSAQ
jgi:hypothetical protein